MLENCLKSRVLVQAAGGEHLLEGVMRAMDPLTEGDG
jgi:small nuclear ribonucleoprotein (snRNP)-like protein